MQAKLGRGAVVRVVAATVAAVATFAGTAADAVAADSSGHGGLVQIVKPGLGFNATQSTNWFGYNQGTLEQGSKQFNAIAGDWTVPAASQHTRNQAEYSSTWIGIGGGCVDAACNVTDNTLIQTGTEQDVDASGRVTSYSAWWELIPAPGITIDGMTVRPGDRMHADISEVVPGSEVWKITLKDVTRGESFTMTVPYSSSHATAEWIQETPVVIGTDGAGVAALPKLTKTAFDQGTTNGAPARLKSSEQMQLVQYQGGAFSSKYTVLGTPSAPDADLDGFGLCAYARACSMPSS